METIDALDIPENFYEQFEETEQEGFGTDEEENTDKEQKDTKTDAKENKKNEQWKHKRVITSKSTYISLLLKCKNEKDKKPVATKKFTRKIIRGNDAVEENSLIVLKRICKNKFPRHSDERIDAYLNEFIDNPPKEKCSLHQQFFEKDEKNIYKKHNILCYLLHFLDCDTLIQYKNCSKLDYEVVSSYLRKILYQLPFKHGNVKTNIHYWCNVVHHFFYKCGTLKPLDRTEYPLVSNALKENSSFCVITKDSMHSTVFVSLDYLNEKLITCCNHYNPLPHTSDPTKEIKGINTFKSQEITLIDFIDEYYKRLHITDDELIWNLYGFRKSKKFLTILLFEYLKCMNNIVNKYNGKAVFKKTEYLINCGHHIAHRIWIQIFYEYGNESNEKKKKKMKNLDPEVYTLYLTIADHYKWDA